MVKEKGVVCGFFLDVNLFACPFLFLICFINIYCVVYIFIVQILLLYCLYFYNANLFIFCYWAEKAVEL